MSTSDEVPSVIVVDYDETLVHADFKAKNYKKLNIWKFPPDIRAKVHTYYVMDKQVMILERPYLHEMIETLHESFDFVVVYSAGAKEYVEAGIECLYAGHSVRPDLILTYYDCIPGDEEGSYHKSMDVVNERLGLSESKIFLVDDRVENFVANPESGINITEYSPKINKRTLHSDPDDSLLKMIEFIKSGGDLSDVAGISNVF